MALNVFFGVYKVLYRVVPVTYRGGVILVLPAWRFAGKHFIMWAMRDLEDFLPQIVAFTVDFFSALFVSACMSTSGPLYLSVLFIALDLLQAVLEFREVRANATSVVRLLHDRRASREYMKPTNSRRRSNTDVDDLVLMILAVTRNPSVFNVTSLQGVRLRACLPHPLKRQQVEQLLTLEAAGVCGVLRKVTRQRTTGTFCRRGLLVFPSPTKFTQVTLPGSTTTVDVASNKPLPAKECGVQPKVTHSVQRSQRIVSEGLQLLFHCEYLALVEYVECVIPIVFMAYKSVLAQLPNIVYYSNSTGNWGVEAVEKIVVFSAMEVVTLVVLDVFLRRTFCFSPLHQLAFVLETQFYLVQSSLWTVILTLMQFELEHSGTDFTFRFQWLHNNTA